MKMKSIGLFLAINALFCLAMVVAQPDKNRPGHGKGFINMEFLFYATGKGWMPPIPGLQAVLMLTNEQQKQIVAARREMYQNPELVELQKAAKVPEATKEQKEALQKARKDAETKLREKINTILTTDQKGLIDKVKTSILEVHQVVDQEFKQKRAELEKEERSKLLAEVLKKLDMILSPDQKAAMEKVAAEQKQKEVQAAEKTEKKDLK